MKPDDDNWFETLAGRPPAGTDPATLREATLLRQALRHVVPDVAVTPAQDSLQLLLARAQAEGLLSKGWCTTCAARWQRWMQALRQPWPAAGMAVALLLMALVALPLLQTAPEDGPTLRAGEDGVLLLQDAAPAARRDQVAAALQAAGAQVQRYERLGRFGLDAQWPTPPTDALVQALRAEGIGVPAGGELRLEVQPLAGGPP